MRLSTNLVISVVFLALLGFVYFYEIKGGEEREKAAERDRKLVEFQDHEAQVLHIDRGDTVLVVQMQDNEWMITDPVRTGADREAVDRYLRALRDTETEGDPLRDSSAVAADPSILEEYGLATPRLRVHVGLLADAPPLDTLLFGDDTPTDRFTYVRRAGPGTEVERVRAWRFDNLDKGLHDLRDRRLLAFDVADVKQLRIRRAGGTDIDAQRTGDDWSLNTPFSRRANKDEIEGILRAVQSEETERVVSENPDADMLRNVGLSADAEAIELTVWLGEDRAEKRLRLGSAAEDGRLHAVDSSRPHLFLVDTTTVGKLRTPLDDVRDKHVLFFDESAVQTVALLEGGETVFEAERDTSATWVLSSPADREAKVWRFTTLLGDLSALEATGVVVDAESVAELALPAFGLDKPAWSVLLTLANGSSVRLDVGSARDGEVFVRTDQSATIVTVADDDAQGLHLSLDDVSSAITQDDDDVADSPATDAASE